MGTRSFVMAGRPGKIRKKLSASSYNLLPLLGSLALALKPVRSGSMIDTYWTADADGDGTATDRTKNRRRSQLPI
jgi:hypothetical protein